MAPQSVYSESSPQLPDQKVIASRLYSLSAPSPLAELQKLCSAIADRQLYVKASTIEKNIPIYDTRGLNLDDTALQDEWNHLLLNGPGVFVLKNMYQESNVLDAANEAFTRIIRREAAGSKGDHFAAGGKNDRIWNSFSKHCLEDAESFVTYYSNPWLARVCEAWLGPAYRITAQTNIVKPGGKAQVSHRDYHLGFQSEVACARFPRSIQIASQLLTLQGAVAHSDMPVESGPTRFLPFSQTLEEGYMAYRRPEVIEYFLQSFVSLPLRRGDGVFFNPALMHAAGENRTTDFSRIGNLIQASSAFGKTMETIDSIPLVEKCWPFVADLFERSGWDAHTQAIVAALGEGYPFPTNLDRRPPAPGGMAPSSEQDLLKEALDNRRSTVTVVEALQQLRSDSSA